MMQIEFPIERERERQQSQIDLLLTIRVIIVYDHQTFAIDCQRSIDTQIRDDCA